MALWIDEVGIVGILLYLKIEWELKKKILNYADVFSIEIVFIYKVRGVHLTWEYIIKLYQISAWAETDTWHFEGITKTHFLIIIYQHVITFI